MFHLGEEFDLGGFMRVVVEALFADVREFLLSLGKLGLVFSAELATRIVQELRVSRIVFVVIAKSCG